MTNKLAQQTQNAFDFVQKLYFEISYLIKEIEVLLQREEENFIIARASGYAVTSRTSSGLEPVYVDIWLPKTMTVAFVPEDKMASHKGQTVTPFQDDLRVIVLHIEVTGKSISEPRVLAGYIENIQPKGTWAKKFEQLMTQFSYNHAKIFNSLPIIGYESRECLFTGEVVEKPLYSINSSEAVAGLVAEILDLYRK